MGVIVGIQKIIIHADFQTFPDFLELGKPASHYEIDVGKLIIFPYLANQFHSVELFAEAAVSDDETGRSGLETLIEFGGGGKVETSAPSSTS